MPILISFHPIVWKSYSGQQLTAKLFKTERLRCWWISNRQPYLTWLLYLSAHSEIPNHSTRWISERQSHLTWLVVVVLLHVAALGLQWCHDKKLASFTFFLLVALEFQWFVIMGITMLMGLRLTCHCCPFIKENKLSVFVFLLLQDISSNTTARQFLFVKFS